MLPERARRRAGGAVSVRLPEAPRGVAGRAASLPGLAGDGPGGGAARSARLPTGGMPGGAGQRGGAAARLSPDPARAPRALVPAQGPAGRSTTVAAGAVSCCNSAGTAATRSGRSRSAGADIVPGAVAAQRQDEAGQQDPRAGDAALFERHRQAQIRPGLRLGRLLGYRSRTRSPSRPR